MEGLPLTDEEKYSLLEVAIRRMLDHLAEPCSHKEEETKWLQGHGVDIAMAYSDRAYNIDRERLTI